MNVYALICAVTADLKKDGISKDRKNAQQGYAFRGIDDVFNALAPLLSKHKLVILPRVLSRSVTERSNKSGGILFSVVVEVEFDFVSSVDLTKHVVKTYGEAMDSGDKATNKAMSAAYKYAALQTFCVPTEGDNDPDATTHEPQHDDLEAKIVAALTTEELREVWTACAQLQTVNPEQYKRLKSRVIAKRNELEAVNAAANT